MLARPDEYGMGVGVDEAGHDEAAARVVRALRREGRFELGGGAERNDAPVAHGERAIRHDAQLVHLAAAPRTRAGGRRDLVGVDDQEVDGGSGHASGRCALGNRPMIGRYRKGSRDSGSPLPISPPEPSRGVLTERMARTLEQTARAPARRGTSNVDRSDAIVAAALASRDAGACADAPAAAHRLVEVALRSTDGARAWVLLRHEGSSSFVAAAHGPTGGGEHLSLPIGEAARLRASAARAGRRIRPGRPGAPSTRCTCGEAGPRRSSLAAPASDAAPLPWSSTTAGGCGCASASPRSRATRSASRLAPTAPCASRSTARRPSRLPHRHLQPPPRDACSRRSAARAHARAALPALIIDNRAFNDTCGHLAGDDVLRVLARIVVHAARTTDVVGRYGGEEFMVVLPDTPVENAVVLAERLRADVEKFGREHVTQWRGRPPTISIGVCAVSPRDDSEAAIGRCDRALYESKHRGRNCFSIGLSDEDAP